MIPRVIPCLLLDSDQRLVKTVRFDDPDYVGDPVNVLSIFSHFEVDEIVLLDIRATADGRRPPFELLTQLAGECMIPLGYGGGIASVEDARRILETGLEKVVLGTVVDRDPGLVKEIADVFGSQAVAVAVDVVRRPDGTFDVVVESGRRSLGVDPVTWARHAEDLGAGEILLTAVHRDGTLDGYDLELIGSVAEAVTVPLIANGGAGSRDDLRRAVVDGHASAVAAGSIFVYQGKRRGVLVNFPSRAQLDALFA